MHGVSAINADWLKDYVFNTLADLVNKINNASHVAEIGESYPHINPVIFIDTLHDDEFELLPNPSETHINGKYVHLIQGPMKSTASAMRKVHNYRKEHATNKSSYVTDALYLKDQLRFTISVADPMLATMCVYGMLDFEHIKLVGIKNKYLGDADAIATGGSPSILVNLQIDLDPLPPLIFEVQVYFDTFLTHKLAQHKTYEFARAKSATDLLHPVFDSASPHMVSHGAEMGISFTTDGNGEADDVSY